MGREEEPQAEPDVTTVIVHVEESQLPTPVNEEVERA